MYFRRCSSCIAYLERLREWFLHIQKYVEWDLINETYMIFNEAVSYISIYTKGLQKDVHTKYETVVLHMMLRYVLNSQ